MADPDWELQDSFGKRLEAWLKQQKMRQKNAARQLHSNQAHISRLVRGERTPTYNDIVQMVNAWGRDVTMRLLFDTRHSAHGITWIEPWPMLLPGIQMEETTTSLDAFHQVMSGNRVEKTHDKHMSNSFLLNRVKQCFLSGLVLIQDVKRDEFLERELSEKYGLRNCIVSSVDLPSNPVTDTVIRAEAVAFLAAKDAIYSALNVHNVGITGGSPIYRFIDMLVAVTEQLRGVNWWSLISTYPGAIGGAPAGTSANDTIARLAYVQPTSICHPLPFVHTRWRSQSYREQATAAELEAIRLAELSLENARQVETAFLSVGSPDFEFQRVDATLRIPALRELYEGLPERDRAACVGDVLLQAVDSSGRLLGKREDYDRFVYSISHQDLREIVARGGTVWVLAERPNKAAIVQAMLESGMANAAVIDRRIAQTIVMKSS